MNQQVILNGRVLECEVEPSLQVGQPPAWRTPIEINGKLTYGVNVNGYSYPPAEPGCVLYLPGLPGQGATIWDRSNQGNHGTITGATWRKLPSGLWALSFDGDDRVTIPLGFTGTTISFLVWCKSVSDITTLQGIIGSDTDLGSGIWLNAGKYYPFHKASQATTGVIAVANTWHFLVATFTGLPALPTLTISSNGGTPVSAASANTGNIGNIRLGVRNVANASPLLNGQIVLVRAITAILSTAQTLSIFNQERHLLGV